MARGLSSVGVLAVMVVAAIALAAPRCAAQTSGCTTSILSLSPCLSFTTGSSSAPSSPCCSALASVVQGAPRCLCAVLGGGATAALGVTVNTTRALELPGKCKIQTPAVSQCNAVGGAPAATPGAGSASPAAPAPTAEAPAAPAPAAHSTTGAGSKATPATGAVSSHAGVTKSAAVSVSFVVAFALLMAL